jgi:hypothetical protein
MVLFSASRFFADFALAKERNVVKVREDMEKGSVIKPILRP